MSGQGCARSRVLRPGGRFVLADPALPVWVSRLILHFGANRSHAPAALVRSCAAAGLQVRGQERVVFRAMLITNAVRALDSGSPEQSRTVEGGRAGDVHGMWAEPF